VAPTGLPLWVGPGQQVRRVLRGGAFNNEDRNVRCAARNRNNPNNWNRNNGFRLVASHDFRDGRKCPVGGTLPGRGEKDGVARSWPRPERKRGAGRIWPG